MEVIVLLEKPKEMGKPSRELIDSIVSTKGGFSRGGFSSVVDVDEYIRKERDSCDD